MIPVGGILAEYADGSAEVAGGEVISRVDVVITSWIASVQMFIHNRLAIYIRNSSTRVHLETG